MFPYIFPNQLLGSSMWSTDEGTVGLDGFQGRGANIFFGNSYYGRRGRLIGRVKRHLLSVAPTRSGKGVSLIIPNLLNYMGSIIVIDPKGENAYLTAKRRRELGQKTYILDPWGEVNRRYGKNI
jgi:type IV secretion system protein VirD4